MSAKGSIKTSPLPLSNDTLDVGYVCLLAEIREVSSESEYQQKLVIVYVKARYHSIVYLNCAFCSFDIWLYKSTFAYLLTLQWEQ